NGSDLDATLYGVTSTPILLAPDAEPENFTGESGRDSFMDDANDDNTNLTVDFGFFKPVAIGNLVFIDANYNGRAESNEGVAGVEVQLFEDGTTPLFDSPIDTQTTDANGHYLFENLNSGSYYVHVPSAMFASDGPLYLHASVADVQSGDDNMGEDGIDDGRPDVNGISTAVILLSPTTCPIGSAENGFQGTTDDASDAATDLTRDFGFVPRVQVGNLVFRDANGDGIYDPNSESGIDNLSVQLWSGQGNATAPLATTTTSNGGQYSFGIAPGSYHIRIPGSAFASGAAAQNLVATPATANTTGVYVDDDAGQDGYSTSASVETDGVRTANFTILPGLTPDDQNGETGFLSYEDDSFDHDSDMTVDIGLAPKPIGVGNLVFNDSNADGHFTAGVDFGIPGVLIELYATGSLPGSTAPLTQTYSTVGGAYELRAPGAGDYFLHIPASEFASGKVLAGSAVVAGFGTDEDHLDDAADEDTLNAANPATTGVNSIVFNLAYGMEPTGSQESGFGGSTDDSRDADFDYTIDLGFTGVISPVDLGIGNVVFFDADSNGAYTAGEGVAGVWMLLYRGTDQAGQQTPFRSTSTDSSGRYLFSNLPPDTYTVHVAADNFKANIMLPGSANLANGPLYGRVSLSGNQSTVADDNVGEDGLDAASPSLVGISSAAFVLQIGSAPTGANESGFDGASDNSKDANYNLTIDFGFVAAAGFPLAQRERVIITASAANEAPAPITFASWTSENTGSANDDNDADGSVNLLEYALGTDAASGVQKTHFSLTTDAITGRVDALLIRPSGGRTDLTYQIETLTDLRQADTGWSRLLFAPAVTQNNDGTETVSYVDIASANVFAGANHGFLRVKVLLDADLNGTSEATATSVPQAWLSRAITERQTFSMPLLKADIFVGKVSAVDGSTLTLPASITLPAVASYVEVLTTGQRFEINAAESSGTRIALLGTPSITAGTRIAIRPHWSAAELFPVDLFTPGTSAENADRLMFFDGAAFHTSWLSNNGWTGDSDGTRIITPGEGLLIHARTGAITLTTTGAVRMNRFAQPLSDKAQLIGSGFLLDHSPRTLGFTTANGFTAGTSSATADRLRLWSGDFNVGDSTYRNFFLQQRSTSSAWIQEDDTTQLDQSAQTLLSPGQAFFILPRTALPARAEDAP
ncbi:MAG: SdrD B-like domain-containing protein, partial [Prosthecobacter sp.]